MPFVLFVAALFTTEFFYIEVFGGILRIYHLMAPVIILALFRYWTALFRSGVFKALLAFGIANFVAASFADVPPRALTSLGLLGANVAIAIAVALILASGRLTMRELVRVALGLTVISIFWGVFQVLVYKLWGWNLALSDSQEWQLRFGFSSGLRTEANSFAKSLNVIALLILPYLLTLRDRRRVILLTAILIGGMLSSFTRSAIYGLAVTLILVYFWYLMSRRGRVLSPRPIVFFVLTAVAVVLFASFVGSFNHYAQHKIDTFFDSEEIVAGDSSGFRLMQHGLLWDAFLESGKTFLLGNGWGQVYFYHADTQLQAGGSELATVFAYGGAIAGVIFLTFQLLSINAARRMIKFEPGTESSKLFEGAMFALVSLPITGSINSAIIAPEYWMMYGIALYCGAAVWLKSRAPLVKVRSDAKSGLRAGRVSGTAPRVAISEERRSAGGFKTHGRAVLRRRGTAHARIRPRPT